MVSSAIQQQLRQYIAFHPHSECAEIRVYSQSLDVREDEFRMIYSEWKPAAQGDMVLCGGGCKMLIPYTPPYPPDECLCSECEQAVSEMKAKGTL